MTCMEMYGSGVKIGMGDIPVGRLKIRRGQQ